MPNFSDILDQQASEIERPKPLPPGTYLCLVNGLPRQDESSKKKTPYVEFNLTVKDVYRDDAGDTDVDEEALDEMGGLGGEKVRSLRATYYVTEDAKWRLKEFLEHCGIDPVGKSLAMMINESPNCYVLAVIGHKASENGEGVYAEIKRTARA